MMKTTKPIKALALIKESGCYTLREIAVMLGVCEASVCNYIRGHRRPSPELCNKIVKIAEEHEIEGVTLSSVQGLDDD